jgi:hypothetical protein
MGTNWRGCTGVASDNGGVCNPPVPSKLCCTHLALGSELGGRWLLIPCRSSAQVVTSKHEWPACRRAARCMTVRKSMNAGNTRNRYHDQPNQPKQLASSTSTTQPGWRLPQPPTWLPVMHPPGPSQQPHTRATLAHQPTCPPARLDHWTGCGIGPAPLSCCTALQHYHTLLQYSTPAAQYHQMHGYFDMHANMRQPHGRARSGIHRPAGRHRTVKTLSPRRICQ